MRFCEQLRAAAERRDQEGLAVGATVAVGAVEAEGVAATDGLGDAGLRAASIAAETVAVSNWATTSDDVELSIEAILRAATETRRSRG